MEKKILTKDEKKVIDLRFFEACKEIFDLIDEGKVTGINLDKLHVSKNKIEKLHTYYLEDISFSGDLSRFVDGWVTLAKRKRNGKIKKCFRVTTEDQVQFLEDYEDDYKKQIPEKINEIQSKHELTMQKIKIR